MSLVKVALKYKQALMSDLLKGMAPRTLLGSGVGALSGYMTGGPEHWWSDDNRLRNTLIGGALGAGGGALSARFAGSLAPSVAKNVPTVSSISKYVPRGRPATMSDVNPFFKAMAEKEVRYDNLMKAKAMGALAPAQEAELSQLNRVLHLENLPKGAEGGPIRTQFTPASQGRVVTDRRYRAPLPQ